MSLTLERSAGKKSSGVLTALQNSAAEFEAATQGTSVADDAALDLEDCESSAKSEPLIPNGQPTKAKHPRGAKEKEGGKAKEVAQSDQNPIWEIRLIPVDQIGPSPFQPRQEFSEEEMEDLAASVAEHGVQTPVLVRTVQPVASEEVAPALPTKKANAGKRVKLASADLAESETANANASVKAAEPAAPRLPFELVTGERRLRACLKSGRLLIPAIVRDDLSDAQAAEISLVENVQRSNLNIVEEGRGYRRLMLLFRYTEVRIAKKVGKSVGTVQAAIKLLELPESVLTLLLRKQLTASHGHELLKLAPHPDICVLVALKAYTEKISATSLAQNVLPNAQQLKRRGQIVELGYQTKFDWKNECQNCPFKAFVTSGYGSYCLKPEEWRRKQDHAVEMAKQEAARTMADARQEGEATVAARDLEAGSYFNLRLNEVPAGCSPQCACRGQIADPTDASKSIPICLNPERFKELKKEQREAQQAQRERHFSGLWQGAVQRLIEPSRVSISVAVSESSANEPSRSVESPLRALDNGTEPKGDDSGNGVAPEAIADNSDAGVPPSPVSEVQVENRENLPQRAITTGFPLGLAWNKIAAILVLPALAGSHGNYFGDRNWEAMVERTAQELGIELPLEEVMGQIDDRVPLRLLEAVEPGSLLLLGAAVLLRQESDHAARWGGETRLLQFVLDQETPRQSELELNDGEISEPEMNEPKMDEPERNGLGDEKTGEDDGHQETGVTARPQDEPEFGEVVAAPNSTLSVTQSADGEVTPEVDLGDLNGEARHDDEDPNGDDERLIAMLESEQAESEEREDKPEECDPIDDKTTIPGEVI